MQSNGASQPRVIDCTRPVSIWKMIPPICLTHPIHVRRASHPNPFTESLTRQDIRLSQLHLQPVQNNNVHTATHTNPRALLFWEELGGPCEKDEDEVNGGGALGASRGNGGGRPLHIAVEPAHEGVGAGLEGQLETTEFLEGSFACSVLDWGIYAMAC